MPSAVPIAASNRLALIGFGEAAQAFVDGMARPEEVRAFDLKTLDPDSAATKRADYARFAVAGAETSADAILNASAILCLVTADQAVAAAETAAATIAPGALYLDGNSVSPDAKRAAALAIEAAGGRYVDVAIMSPVRPSLMRTPLLVSGPHAGAGEAHLRALGFGCVRALDGPVGSASAVKMIRSVMIKGMEALTAECLIAAVAAGVDDEVIASLDASEKLKPWAERGDYNLDRMMVHGTRRAAEMEEVVKTLENLGVAAPITRAVTAWQAAIGSANLKTPPEGYPAKVSAIEAAGVRPRVQQ
jgi:3-hydroxyisobutyrate dehydrogenase-like beta-hydroxyacid dehydrogenase